MEIRPVQYSINTKSKEHTHYLDAEGAVDTTGLVKPLPGKGHLIHDKVSSAPKYFVTDIAYDLKSLKNGFNGTANDHQLGRLNDIGLQVGGVGIATYLASKTTNPKARIMEYTGLAAFLTAMNIFPKIAINTPSRIIHGYDTGKWYIDDQGRKKSVNQDSNYRPMDLYRGERSDEHLDKIADDMGIPRGIKNRNELTYEQTRKLATQNQTLWMLTAGFATPVITALACYGLENYVISPQLEKARNKKYNKLITDTLEKTKAMSLVINDIKDNDLSIQVANLFKGSAGKELSEEKFEDLVELLTKNTGNNVSEGLREDLKNAIKESTVINKDVVDKMITTSKDVFNGNNKEALEEILIPTQAEVEEAIKKVVKDANFENGFTTSPENIIQIKEELHLLINKKIEASNTKIAKKKLTASRNRILNNMENTMKASKSKVVTEENIQQFINVAKVLGEFKEYKLLLNKCESFKFEFAPETVLARSYGKFEKALVKELGITTQDMKKMRESAEFTTELLNTKISEICQDEEKYKKVFKNLSDVISEMEVNLNGVNKSNAEASNILDLINAIENNYNNTAKRLSQIGGFDSTIRRLVTDDVNILDNSIKTRQELFDLLDGTTPNAYKMGAQGKNEACAYYNSKGVGSSKYLEISRIIERYQGVKNSFNRVLHTFEFYKRTISPDTVLGTLDGLTGNHKPLSRTDVDYIQALIKKGRSTLLGATSSDHNLKLDLINNPLFYKDLMNMLYTPEVDPNKNSFWYTKAKGYVTDAAKDILKDGDNNSGNLLERFQTYITRCRNILANGPVDFTKPFHSLDPSVRNSYTMADKTRMAFFNLVAQSPVDMLQGAAKRQYGTKKWFKSVATVASTVFGVTLLAQAGFGRIRNPHNIKKQVNNETN